MLRIYSLQPYSKPKYSNLKYQHNIIGPPVLTLKTCYKNRSFHLKKNNFECLIFQVRYQRPSYEVTVQNKLSYKRTICDCSVVQAIASERLVMFYISWISQVDLNFLRLVYFKFLFYLHWLLKNRVELMSWDSFCLFI